MTTQARNEEVGYIGLTPEAHVFEDALARIPDRAYDWADDLLRMAFAAERRATVERIREQLTALPSAPDAWWRSGVERILDEEAAR